MAGRLRIWLERTFPGEVLVRVLGVLGLLGVGLLASWFNQGRYHLVLGGDVLEVRRGVFLPIGDRPFQPAEGPAPSAYAPVELPPGWSVARERRTFRDRAELDQELFALLLGLSRFHVDRVARAQDGKGLAEAERVIAQVARIPAISLRQRMEVERLEHLLAYQRAVLEIEKAQRTLQRTRDELSAAVQAGAVPADAALISMRAAAALRALRSDPGDEASARPRPSSDRRDPVERRAPAVGGETRAQERAADREAVAPAGEPARDGRGSTSNDALVRSSSTSTTATVSAPFR